MAELLHKPHSIEPTCLPTSFIFPFAAIETTMEAYQCKPADVRKKGPLHTDRKTYLSGCVKIENRDWGCYLAFGLGR